MIIEKTTELAKLCSDLGQSSTVYLDTEFVGEGRYYPAVGAIQVATDDRAALIDPLALRDLTPLFDVLLADDIEKVFHAGRQDLAIFFEMMGHPVAPVFDVQIAAALLGYDEQISLANLVHRVTKQSPRKSHAFTDWLRRPLTHKQVEYALDDVRCLAPGRGTSCTSICLTRTARPRLDPLHLSRVPAPLSTNVAPQLALSSHHGRHIVPARTLPQP